MSPLINTPGLLVWESPEKLESTAGKAASIFLYFLLPLA
jgi:hypothetical protein